jgi:hypothetical protein
MSSAATPLAADAAGWVGALTLVGAYAATSVGRVRSVDRSYQLLNAVGSLGLGAVAWAHHTWPSLALNALWLLIAGVTLRRTFARTSGRPNTAPAPRGFGCQPQPDLVHSHHTEQGAPPCPHRQSFPRSPTWP